MPQCFQSTAGEELKRQSITPRQPQITSYAKRKLGRRPAQLSLVACSTTHTTFFFLLLPLSPLAPPTTNTLSHPPTYPLCLPIHTFTISLSITTLRPCRLTGTASSHHHTSIAARRRAWIRHLPLLSALCATHISHPPPFTTSHHGDS